MRQMADAVGTSREALLLKSIVDSIAKIRDMR